MLPKKSGLSRTHLYNQAEYNQDSTKYYYRGIPKGNSVAFENILSTRGGSTVQSQ